MNADEHLRDQNASEAEERGPFFIVMKHGSPEIMTEAEINQEEESTMLAGGHFDTLEEAQAALDAGEYSH